MTELIDSTAYDADGGPIASERARLMDQDAASFARLYPARPMVDNVTHSGVRPCTLCAPWLCVCGITRPYDGRR